MLRTHNDQLTLWESILPQELLRLPGELARVDALLDDERFFAPFRSYFDLTFGRPSIPIECYLRLMFLKFRYRLGYESLCAEVADSKQLAKLMPDGPFLGTGSDNEIRYTGRYGLTAAADPAGMIGGPEPALLALIFIRARIGPERVEPRGVQVGDHPVSAVVLGPVQGGIGAGDQPFGTFHTVPASDTGGYRLAQGSRRAQSAD
jgi:hypothetical protein